MAVFQDSFSKWLEASALPDTLSRHDHAGAIGAARPPALQSKPTSGADLGRFRMLRAAGRLAKSVCWGERVRESGRLGSRMRLFVMM